MKISVDVHPLLSYTRSGIGYYESEMLKAIIDKSSYEDKFILNYFDPKPGNPKNEFVKKYVTGKVSVDCCRWFSSRFYRLIWCIVPFPYTFFFRSKTDISVFFNFYLPPFASGKKVLAVYDTVIKDCPGTMSFKTKAMLGLTIKRSVRRADKIVTISEFSKGQIMKHFGVDEKNIIVAPCAADRNKFYPMEGNDDTINSVKNKYGIEGSYFLYLGTLEPRKNIAGLVDAYIMAKNKNAALPKLVIAGGKGWLYDEIFSKADNSECRNDIIFTGYVDDGDVPVLMNGANAFCFPSLYEGFGMPPLEAMACGTPAIVSNCTSLPEVVGDCGITVDPYSVKEISDALLTAADDSFKKEQKEKCLKRADCFSWDKSADILYKELKFLAEE